MVRTSLCTLTALLTLGRIDVTAVLTRMAGIKLTSIHAGLTKTVLAVVGNHIAGDRTILAGSMDHMDQVTVVMLTRSHTHSKAGTLTDDLPLLIDTTTELRLRTRNQALWQVLDLLLELSSKSKLCNCCQHVVFDFDYSFVSVHLSLSPFSYHTFFGPQHDRSSPGQLPGIPYPMPYHN